MSLRRQHAITVNVLSHVAQGDTKVPGTIEKAWNTRIATLLSAYNRADAEKTLRGNIFNYMNQILM